MVLNLKTINILIVLSIVFTSFMLVFTFSTAFTITNYIHHSRWGVNSVFDETTELQGNHSYKVQVTLTDDDATNAIVQGSMEVYINDELVESRNFSDYDWPDSDEDARATDTESVWLYPETDCELRVVIHLDDGDEWSYVLFENLPMELVQQELFYGILSVLGIIVTLVLILMHVRYYGKSKLAKHERKDSPADTKILNDDTDEELGVEFYD
ncbi:MAG: hypothetical protein KAU48_09220 [Candidatus Thorarchaeota archaeon]|nr:hypothetical protein [Candidatus Thorarchaeota archaeon]